ncbi:hypothetical protein UT300003_29780 [Clostridium sardiniense]|uniref:GlcG/HbpS family heme-binding protein n=1 Tax=Clostridium sardiniense TaxID=29369 RepID=UPI00195948EC|nr:heme-binding protein [Clostridium sardiniense]MBM7835680.1 uncharacterized protein GlcG (DUF336 family) [Clostridium sardiniense]
MIDNDIAHKITENIITSLKDNTITLNKAKEILNKAEAKAKEINISVTIAIVDEGGNLIAQHKMDNALLISITAALNKAYTAIALKMDTEKVHELILPSGPFYGLENIHPGKLCTLGGGIPIINHGKFIGAIGVSGGSIDEDVLIAKTALK